MMLVSPGTSNEKVLKFYYDAEGRPICFDLNETIYFYVTNLQGDVVALTDSYGEVVSYQYDAWGKPLATDYISSAVYDAMYYNPLRYRGYIYDNETGFYYLQSRYYDPVIGRFINSDGQLNDSTLGYNLFAYCENNPVNMSDPTGHAPDWNKIVMGAMLVGIGVLGLAAVIAIGGTCAPLVAAAYAVYATAALVTVSVGVSEIVEGASGENPMKENLGEEAYNALAATSFTVLSFGPAIFSAGSMSACFVAGTPVKAENGDIPIEQITAGMLVYAHDPETGETALKEVVRTFVKEANELVHITVNGEEIVCTNEHPFYSPVKGWIAACKLRAGDILVMLNGERVVVEQVQHELLETPVTVYNFEVEGFHTYYVGGSGVLVHNQCAYESPSKQSLNNASATEAAKKLGYRPTNYYSHKQKVFYNPKTKLYITPDVDGHNGGVWKMAKTVEDLSSKSTRMGTYDEFLNRKGD